MPPLTIRESHTIVKLGKRIHDNWVFYNRSRPPNGVGAVHAMQREARVWHERCGLGKSQRSQAQFGNLSATRNNRTPRSARTRAESFLAPILSGSAPT